MVRAACSGKRGARRGSSGREGHSSCDTMLHPPGAREGGSRGRVKGAEGRCWQVSGARWLGMMLSPAKMGT